MRIRLSPEDRTRHNITDEWLHFDPALVRVQDVIFLQSIGYADVGALWDGLFGKQLIENGKFVHELDADGQPLLDEEQLPIIKRGPRELLAWAALVYLVLRRHGIDTPWDTFEYTVRGFDWEPDETAGKADPEESTTSET